MRMEQYLQCIDYTLWEIIENGNAPIVTKLVDGKETAIPPTKWTMHTIVWRNKPEIEILSLDDLFNNLKAYESKVKGTSNSTTNSHNVAFLSSSCTNNASGVVNTAQGVNTASTRSDQAEEGLLLSWLILQQVQVLLQTLRISVVSYKTGLESVEARSLVFKKNEFVYVEDIKLLKHEIYLRDLDITELKRKLELVTKEKDKVQLTVQKFENSSKSLRELLDRQIMDKCKIGLGYNAIPPPYTGNFMPPKPDLVYLVNESASESVVEKPTVKTNEPKTARGNKRN
ncbi:hypothetical protein Tco_1532583 [Tanacetum coccineum]